jgi:hypothetical protein
MEPSSSRYNQPSNYLPNADRCCSFCFQSGHTIRNCCHENIGQIRRELYDVLIYKEHYVVTEILMERSLKEICMMCVIMNMPIYKTKAMAISMIARNLLITREYVEAINLFSRQVVLREERKLIINTIEIGKEEMDKHLECPICYENVPIEDTFLTNCDHSFCISCINSHLKSDTKCNCPMCRTDINELTCRKSVVNPDIAGKREVVI